MDLRTYGIGAQILRDLGVCKMKLLASPRKMPSMTGFQLEVTGYQREPLKPDKHYATSNYASQPIEKEQP
jgi:GTP cyclohydrolase II